MKTIKKNMICEACDSAYEVLYYPGAITDSKQTYCCFCGMIVDNADEYIDEETDDNIEYE